MYLSKIRMVSAKDITHKTLELPTQSAYAAHQMLWKLFSHASKRPFLFREEIGIDGKPEYFTLSQIAPQQLATGYLIQTKSFAPRLQIGDKLAFKLRTNPTICMTDATGKKRRHDVLMHAKKQLKMIQDAKSNPVNPLDINDVMRQAAYDWINNQTRQQQWGVQWQDLPDIERYLQHSLNKKDKSTAIQFSSVDFQGILTVNNPEQFLQQLQQGFGRCKAFGCGLMLIRRI